MIRIANRDHIAVPGVEPGHLHGEIVCLAAAVDEVRDVRSRRTGTAYDPRQSSAAPCRALLSPGCSIPFASPGLRRATDRGTAVDDDRRAASPTRPPPPR